MEIKNARSIKIRHLAAFIEITRTGSLKAAAERVFLTQPAISKTLKDLEEIVGAPLLERDRGGVGLTRQGEIFLPFAEQSLAALNHGLASLEAANAGSATPLRVGALPSVAAGLLPGAVQCFADLSPTTPVSVEDGRLGALVDRLRSGELDLVIGRMGRPETMTGLSFTQLYSEHVVFVVAPDHPLKDCGTLAALSNWLVLYPPKGSAIRPLVDRFMIAHHEDAFPKRLETVSGAFGRSMTLGSAHAVWIISRGVVAQDLAAGHLVALSIDTSMTSGPVGIMARAEEDPTPPARLFRKALIAAAEHADA